MISCLSWLLFWAVLTVKAHPLNAKFKHGFLHPRHRFPTLSFRFHHAGINSNISSNGEQFHHRAVAERTRRKRTLSAIQDQNACHESEGLPQSSHLFFSSLQFIPKQRQCHDDDETARNHGASNTQEKNPSCFHRRRFLMASAILASQLPLSSHALGDGSSSSTTQSNYDLDQRQILNSKAYYQKSPINKRYGITLSEPERIYPINFITYLSRFLLVYDPECQAWWYTQATGIPPKSSQEDVNRIRLEQFGKFAASVEVGLMEFEGDDGVRLLLGELVKRYADVSLDDSTSGDRKEPFPSGSGSSSSSSSTLPSKQQQQKLKKKKEALRQIALMFSLLKEYQPVDLITQLLAAYDDATIEKVDVTDVGAGYLPPEYKPSPKVTFADPPTLGTVFGGSVAKGNAIMKESGRVLKVDMIDGGSGYTKAPIVEISPPNTASVESAQATAKAFLGKGKSKGSIERIEIVNRGMGYLSTSDVTVAISPPEAPDGREATAKAILEYQVAGVEIVHPGRGYAAERPIRILIEPPPGGGGSSRPATAISYPRGRSTSYKSFLPTGDSEAEIPQTSSNWINGPTSSQLLTLLPSGFGLEFDTSLKRYILTTATSDDFNVVGTLEGVNFKPINPIFGIRGRSPIEREKSLDASTVLRFMASGAVCSSVAHLILTPIDVVKTKVQTKPDTYNGGIVDTFKKVLNEEGARTFFDGWEPTFLGFFISGGIAFFLTEFFRRYYSSLIVASIMAQSSSTEAGATAIVTSLEIPLIAASAATSGFLCCFLLAPFDAIRIRTVSQPDFADNIFGVVSRMIKEEGFISLFSSVTAWILKEVPYNVVKFLVFDTFTEWAYFNFPAAREDIRLSLAVSLVGGTFGGIAASIVSNPADCIVSEMKKAKSDMSPWEAADVLRQRGGLKAFSSGLTLRMMFYSLLVSLQFLLYDAVRIGLGVGSDDMKLYLNVLGAALKEVSDA
ncbi:hypothetical protein HJC23_011765 [Cyclotella cryptica]|uniref:Uncharacterized protein n=1 Tax=Cyclotella cryptica TaxID=29204 RepID=A0ABD3PIE6_9STRA|eukprot:CCRYP_014822-RA/>CCRYP_014822-RA protein AED:0.01 eAED:0.01 QI:527/1/1/1/1/1/2/118/960